MLAVVGAGCRARGPSGFEQFIPDAAPARAAVAATLEAWRAGKPTDAAVSTSPLVYVVDKQRRPGQRLSGYEILGEVSAEMARGYAVRLTLENPDEPQIVRFLVVGVNPLWVFRQEDYEDISHWMHSMNESQAPAAETVPDRDTSPRP
jgi:hypothetical protein